MRRFSQKRNRNKKGLLLIACLFLILIALVFLFFKSGLFNIKKVEVNLDKNLDCVNENQLKNAYPLAGQNLLLVSDRFIEKDVKGKFICVKNMTLSKIFPNRVKMNILGREPAAILVNLKNNDATPSPFLENIATPSAEASLDAFLVDREAIIFSKKVDNLDIPRIFLDGSNLSLGKKLDSILENSLKILEKLKEFGLDVKTTIVLNKSIIIFSSPKIIFSLDNKVETQIASLQLILEKAKIDERSLEFIDLRFDKPIVRFAPKKNG